MKPAIFELNSLDLMWLHEALVAGIEDRWNDANIGDCSQEEADAATNGMRAVAAKLGIDL